MSTVETDRLVLRPWQPDGLAEFTRLLTDPVVTRYIVVHTPFSPQDVAGHCCIGGDCVRAARLPV